MTHAASAVILVRPTGFASDPQTAESNAFQRGPGAGDVRAKAAREFDGLLAVLDRHGIIATVLEPHDPRAPNGVFPNNWFSTHADGTVVLYPMRTRSRRAERDRSMDLTLEERGFRVRRLVDLSCLERDDRFLEGTGSLVLDRVRNTAFAALSPRTSARALNVWCGAMEGHQVPFVATMDGSLEGVPVYHTNVVMSIGEGFAALCLDAIPLPVDRHDVQAELERAGKELIPFSLEQMHRFVGNMLQLAPPSAPRILLSSTAMDALDLSQRRRLEAHGELVPVPVPTIEAVGGGSVRCMLAENFLPAVG